MLTAELQSDGSWLVRNAPMAIDCDGSPRAYHPDNHSGLDDLRNGGPASDPYGYELNPATGRPFIQGKDAPAFSPDTVGFYVSATSYCRKEYAHNDPHRYLNAETECFGVVPGWFRKHVPGVVLGCRMVISYEGQSIEAVAGDVGPSFGEASIACAKRLGINPNGRSGGVDSGVTYRIYPGVRAVVSGVPYDLQPA